MSSSIIFPFKRIELRIKTTKDISFEPSFPVNVLDLWSDFLDYDLSSHSVIGSYLIPLHNNFNYYLGKNHSSSFSLNLVYSDTTIQQKFVENIILSKEELKFNNIAFHINGFFYYRVPELSSLNDLSDVDLNINFHTPTSIITDNKQHPYPTLKNVLNSLRYRLSALLNNNEEDKAILSLFDKIDPNTIDYAIKSYNIMTLSSFPDSVAVLGKIDIHFDLLPSSLLYLLEVSKVVGIGNKIEKGLGWINISQVSESPKSI